MEAENTNYIEESFRKEHKVSWVGYFRFIAVNFVSYRNVNCNQYTSGYSKTFSR